MWSFQKALFARGTVCSRLPRLTPRPRRESATCIGVAHFVWSYVPQGSVGSAAAVFVLTSEVLIDSLSSALGKRYPYGPQALTSKCTCFPRVRA
jgi:hypothetical protein